MRKILPWLIPWPLLAAGPVTITDLTGSTQSNRPFSISRVFKQGDIADYAQPSVGGSPLSTWQCDRKSRWPDGSLKHAIISFSYTIPASASVEVDFANSAQPCSSGDPAACSAAALGAAGMLDFISGAWDGQIEATSATAVTVSARTMVGAGQFVYWLRGPVVTQVIVEDRSTALGRDFGWKDKKYTALAASISNSQTSLNVAYGAHIGALSLPTVIQVDSEQMTVTSVTGNTLSVTRGANGTTPAAHNVNSVLASLSQASEIVAAPDARHKSLHPVFILTFYSGWDGVKIDYILNNTWTDRMQDISYSLALKSGPGGGTERYTRDTFTHYAFSRWRKTYWDPSASEPGGVKVDFNFAYMKSSGAIYNFDPDRTVSDSDVAGEISEFNSSDRGDDYGDRAQIARGFGTTGGRPELAPFPRWTVRYLYTFHPDAYTVMMANADVSGHIPIHYLESRNDGAKYCPNGCTGANANVSAFGKVVSVEAHPTTWLFTSGYGGTLNSGNANGYVTIADRMQWVGAVSEGGWEPDMAHQPSLVYVPYLVTGDYYYLEEMWYWDAWNAGNGNPTRYITGSRGRDWGYHPPPHSQTRGLGWALRNAAHTAFISPDSTPEKEFGITRLNRTAEMLEGFMGITDGNFPPADSACTGYANGSQGGETDTTLLDKWCHGKKTHNRGRSNPLHFVDTLVGGGPGGNCSGLPYAIEFFKCANSIDIGFAWQDGFVLQAVGLAVELGFSGFSKYLETTSKGFIESALHPDAVPYWNLGSIYRPTLDPDGSDYLQTWADYKAVYYQGNSTLSADINATDTTITVADGSGFTGSTGTLFEKAIILIGTERIAVCARTGNTLTVGYSGCPNVNGRGYQGTTAASHSSGAAVTSFYDWWQYTPAGSYNYPMMARMTLSFVTPYSSGSYTGRAAWDWINGPQGVGNYLHYLDGDPRWAIVPRTGDTPEGRVKVQRVKKAGRARGK